MEEEIKKTEEMITDAEVLEVKNEENVDGSERGTTKKKKTDFYIELALFFILGILVGIAIKTEAAKRVTIGYDDYKMKIAEQDYDINKLQSDLDKQSAASAASQGADNSSDQGVGAENNNLGDAQNNASNNANN